jgi:hypothetical protein
MIKEIRDFHNNNRIFGKYSAEILQKEKENLHRVLVQIDV